jgi:uncharacterized protein (DUF885 family)
MRTRRSVLAGALALAAAPAFAADYRAALETAYGGPIDPLAAHRRALAESKACHARVARLLSGQGLATGSVPERLAALFRDERYLFPDDDAGRDKAVAEMNARVAALRPRLPIAFGDLPVPEAYARRMTPAEAAAGKAGFRIPAHDGAPGAYFVDLHAIRTRPSWTLPSVAFHEVIPGHLLQLSLQAAAGPPPERVKVAGAYFEAWAIYAEELAVALGAYAHDPLGEIGYLHWRLFRLARIVADTGLHALGWSQDRAVAEMRGLQGPDIAFVTVEADVERMAKQPARFAADGLGALALTAWRPKDRALWPTFHRKVLADGPGPSASSRSASAPKAAPPRC